MNDNPFKSSIIDNILKMLIFILILILKIIEIGISIAIIVFIVKVLMWCFDHFDQIMNFINNLIS